MARVGTKEDPSSVPEEREGKTQCTGLPAAPCLLELRKTCLATPQASGNSQPCCMCSQMGMEHRALEHDLSVQSP